MLTERSEVSDEEATHIKALNFLWSTKYAGLRGLTEPEAGHMRWNGYNRSVDRAGLRGAILKASTMCQRKHGPHHSGTNRENEKEALQLRLRDNATDDWLEMRAELICTDKRFMSLDAQPAVGPTAQLQQWHAFLDEEPSPGYATWRQHRQLI